MNIRVEGKKIGITEKNVRAYKTMNNLIPDELMVIAYLETFFNQAIDEIIDDYPIEQLSKIVNDMIEMEVRDCASNEVYENA